MDTSLKKTIQSLFPDYFDFNYELNQQRRLLFNQLLIESILTKNRNLPNNNNNNITSQSVNSILKSSQMLGLWSGDYDDGSVMFGPNQTNYFNTDIDDDYHTGNYNESLSYSNDYLLNQLKTPLFYILFMLVLYVLIILVVFMSAIYSHRKRVGYNYDEFFNYDDEHDEKCVRDEPRPLSPCLNHNESECLLVNETNPIEPDYTDAEPKDGKYERFSNYVNTSSSEESDDEHVVESTSGSGIDDLSESANGLKQAPMSPLEMNGRRDKILLNKYERPDFRIINHKKRSPPRTRHIDSTSTSHNWSFNYLNKIFHLNPSSTPVKQQNVDEKCQKKERVYLGNGSQAAQKEAYLMTLSSSVNNNQNNTSRFLNNFSSLQPLLSAECTSNTLDENKLWFSKKKKNRKWKKNFSIKIFNLNKLFLFQL